MSEENEDAYRNVQILLYNATYQTYYSHCVEEGRHTPDHVPGCILIESSKLRFHLLCSVWGEGEAWDLSNPLFAHRLSASMYTYIDVRDR